MQAQRRMLLPLTGKAVAPPPIWLMRQAGRYLPEYRQVRAKAGSFLDLCYNPALAAEVTLQPIRRYGLDAAILFSDILVIPHALGQDVRFVEGEGPRLDAIREAGDLARLDPARCERTLAPVYETVTRVRRDLPPETALIGFCGAPWTVATYMIGGQGSPDQAAARLFAYRDPEAFKRLIDLLVEASVEYLSRQIKAGADLVQIFDTWAGSLPPMEFERWVIAPTRRMVARLGELHPDVPVIGFPRGAGAKALDYALATGIRGLGCDTGMTGQEMARLAGEGGVAVQGNLDPLALVAGGSAMRLQVERLLRDVAGVPYIFNLGHGIVPQTPPEHVAELVALVRRGEHHG